MIGSRSALCDPPSTAAASGRWRVLGEHSFATFHARGVWGAVPANGRFTGLSGSITVANGEPISGDLAIPTATLITGLALRDHHLKGAGFFDVRRFPEITFVADRFVAVAGELRLRGRLQIRDRAIELELPVVVAEGSAGRVTLTARADLDRRAVGLGRSPLGMIRGPASVRINVVLERER